VSAPDEVRDKYLAHYAHSGLPPPPGVRRPWRQVLVIPAYRESPALLTRLAALTCRDGPVLVVLVLNRPDSDPDTGANASLRSAVAGLPAARHSGAPLFPLTSGVDLLLLDLEASCGATPRRQGVGAARKAGCDLALGWIAAGAIDSEWLCNSDADALLPADYFARLPAADDYAAATYPFIHTAGGDPAVSAATALYELRLHHYVLGLEYARSPYAFHTLGSCIAVNAAAYARVRGFPRRAGGEDFYLLNKLAKLGPVARLGGAAIEIESRRSMRVPFGTGPAVGRLLQDSGSGVRQLFYHPATFAILRRLLSQFTALAEGTLELEEALLTDGVDAHYGEAAAAALRTQGWSAALAHCRRHATNDAGRLRHLHQWFDAFRTLKLVHALRDAGLEPCALEQLTELTPWLFPVAPPVNDRIDLLRGACANLWTRRRTEPQLEVTPPGPTPVETG
jgi:hypothetical protein